MRISLGKDSADEERNVTDDPLRPMVLTTVETEGQAAMIVAALGERGIQARSIGGLTSGFRAEAPGGVKVLVRQIDFDQAQAILQAVEAARPGNDKP
jgi:hypothetical protein